MPDFKQNKLTGMVDAAALERFALALPDEFRDMRRTYRRLAKKIRKVELARWRYENWVNQYGENGDVVLIC